MPKPPIRILVVDDSLVIRKVVSDTLRKDTVFEVVGTAGDGRIAIAKLPALNPDLIILDMAMPNMNGMETLVEVRKTHPKLPIIIFSTLSIRGGAETMEALALGASDYATKPVDRGSLEATVEAIQKDLIPKIKVLCGLTSLRVAAQEATPPLRARALPSRIDIVAIGASTGGPNALAEVIPHLPAGFPVPVVIVQHMPATFTGLLAERLSRNAAITVAEGSAGTMLAGGPSLDSAGNFHMTVVVPTTVASGPAWRLSLNQDPPEHSCRPAVDMLFRSVAAAGGPHVLGVVMTGMGADGALGARRIREAGGEVIVQDEATSVVWGMPGAVCAAGQADGIFPLDQLAGEITRRVQSHRAARAVSAASIFAKLESSFK